MKEELREQMEEELKKVLRTIALRDRNNLQLTQSQCAEALVMSLRSYQKIEEGSNGCSALTAFMLLAHHDQREAIVDELCHKLLTIYQGALCYE